MIIFRNLAILMALIALSTSLILAEDLSRYRDFELGSNLLTVATQAHLEPSQARVIHQRPALIQTLDWRPQGDVTSSHSSDPVKQVQFSFYNDQLFRVAVSYDPDRTEGLSDEDMIAGISAEYGTATRPVATIVVFASSQIYSDNEKVVARWEDSQNSFNLFRPSYGSTFGMLVFSKALDAKAQAAIARAIQLDEQEAPQREIERQNKQNDEKRSLGEKARPANKAHFRP